MECQKCLDSDAHLAIYELRGDKTKVWLQVCYRCDSMIGSNNYSVRQSLGLKNIDFKEVYND